MCGQFRLKTSIERLRRRFGALPPEGWLPKEAFTPSRSVRAKRSKNPITTILTYRAEGEARVPALVLWGLIPAWSKEPTGLPGMRPPINAKVETLREKPMFRGLYKKRRCLIPADAYYEWRTDDDGGKTKFLIRPAGDDAFAFAGLWDRWEADDGGETYESAVILTAAPHASVAGIHDRMPVIVPERLYDAWLNPAADVLDEIIEADHGDEGKLEGIALALPKQVSAEAKEGLFD